MTLDQKTKLLALIMAIMDGRNPSMHIKTFTEADCLQAHGILNHIDDLLKTHWVLLGTPLSGHSRG